MKKAYSIHMIGWLLTKSAIEDTEHPLYMTAYRCKYANINADAPYKEDAITWIITMGYGTLMGG